MDEKYTTTQVAAREGVTRARITELAREGRIEGCAKHGPVYVFAKDYRILPAPDKPKAMLKIGRKKSSRR